MSLPRGIPAASLKLRNGERVVWLADLGLPRGIPAASLKLVDGHSRRVLRRVFRGEYPRPH